MFGKYNNEVSQGKEMLNFTSLGPKTYYADIGEVFIEKNGDGKVTFNTKVTDSIVRSKGFTLKYQNSRGVITKNLMREFLEALGKNEEKKLSIAQYRFQIAKDTYKIAPKHYKKLYRNKNLLLKRLYNPKILLSKTFPIGATEFYGLEGT